MLIINGAIVNDKSNYGYSPLYFASRYGHVEVVDILIKNGAIVNEDHKDHTTEFTPLFAASQNGHKKVVQLLLSKGATIEEETIDIAKDEGHTKIVEILEKWPHSMAILALQEQENHAYNFADPIDLIKLNEYMGKKGTDYGVYDFYGEGKRRNKKSIKSKKSKKSKKSIKRRKRI
jgi:hypothetical protein